MRTLQFKEFNLTSGLMEGLDAMGFEKATPIQVEAIPVILNNKDLLACAQTGTGKTAAFILPIIHKIVESKSSGLNTLIIAPTRELAQQIDQQIQGLGYFANVSSMAIFGGGDGFSWEAQKRSLVQGADIVVATPGRLIAMLQTSGVDFSTIKHLILDEADRMLDMGFYDDIMRIISNLPKERQTLLFSATMPPKIGQMASRILQNPEKINLSLSKPAEGINQQAYVVYDEQKDPLLLHILKEDLFESVLIFSSTKIKVKKLAEFLKSKKLPVKAFHSDLEQPEREEILRNFKNRDLRIIVATDVLARGIDVDNINLVLNYDAPTDPEDYVHRVGRTARAAKKGAAITFIGKAEQRKFSRVEKLITYIVPKMETPEFLGKTPEYNPKAETYDNKRGFRRDHTQKHPGKKANNRSQGPTHDKDEKPKRTFFGRRKNKANDA